MSRRQGGRHHVLPLTADIQVRARQLGLDCLTPIRWLKVANIALEASRSARYLCKPNLPNGIVKNDIEQILFLRKPGGYRSPTAEQERLSYITSDDYAHWFSAVWSDVAGERRTAHPAAVSAGDSASADQDVQASLATRCSIRSVEPEPTASAAAECGETLNQR